MVGLCCGLGRRRGEDNSSKVTNNNSSGDLGPDACKVSVNGGDANGKDAKKAAISGPKAVKGGNQSPVLVELFTSQGCSSCPPADAFISRLGRGQGEDATELAVPVIVLAYHVEYWDYLGWKDPFASPTWTLRQRAYGQVLQQDSIYTPEAVVQGRSHCIGSNPSSIMGLLQEAPRFPASDIQATFNQPSRDELKVSLNISLKTKVEGYKLDVMVAIYENGLVTNCAKGENRGRILTNDFVVTGLERACTIQDLPAKKVTKGEVILHLWEGFVRSKCGVVVFLQNPTSLEVFGAQQIDLPEDVM
ncbi:unnamed protein product [Calypogeia fissa]